ncbi:MAG: sulfotransferase domain-containing protein [Desulfobacteraceae bacterium]|jgi:hypothetical protein
MNQEVRKPDFFIVGAPKCGTTAMTAYLRQHNEIFIPNVKELHFFGADLTFRQLLNRAPDWFQMTEEKYLSYFAAAGDEKRLGEASAGYLYSESAASEIKNFSPDADIIIMLRNPVEMLYSWHSQSLYVCNEDIESFEEAFNAQEDRKHGMRIPDTAFWVEGLCYSEMAKFAKHVKRYIDIFGLQKVHVIAFDDFKENTGNVYQETLRFLGVYVEFRPDFRIINPNKVLRSQGLQKILVKPPSIFQPLGKAVSRNKMLRAFIVKWLTRLNTRYETRPLLNPEFRRRLQSQFAPEIEKLSRLLNRDFSRWTKEV